MIEDATRLRAATPGDAPVLARLRYAFRAESGDATEPEHAFVARCDRWMAERLAPGSTWRCWVVERGGEIVGNAWAQAVEKVPNPVVEPEVHVYVTNCYVRPQERGAGLGGRLLDAAVEWGRELGAHAIFLWPSERSRSLYLRRGFAVRDDLFALVLEKGSR
jgi:GNAT superfamily N-acetyltransferase